MKRLWFYLALAAVFAIAVVIKMGVIKEKESAAIVSILGEWQRDGVPVETYEVSRQDLVRTEKLTGEVKSPRRLEAAVSVSLARMLSHGDPVSLPLEEGKVLGVVEDVARSPSATGLFQVVIALKAPTESPIGSLVAVDVDVDRVSNVIVVPSSAVRSEAGKSFVWKLEDKVPVRTEVQVGESSRELVQIRSGLQVGDLVVARGQSNIEEDLGVQIIGTL